MFGSTIFAASACAENSPSRPTTRVSLQVTLPLGSLSELPYHYGVLRVYLPLWCLSESPYHYGVSPSHPTTTVSLRVTLPLQSLRVTLPPPCTTTVSLRVTLLPPCTTTVSLRVTLPLLMVYWCQSRQGPRLRLAANTNRWRSRLNEESPIADRKIIYPHPPPPPHPSLHV